MRATVARFEPINPPCIVERADPAVRWPARRPFRAASEGSNHPPAIGLTQATPHPAMAAGHTAPMGQHVAPWEGW